MMAKQILSISLIITLMFTIAFAEEEKPKSTWDGIIDWAAQAADDAGKWITDAADDVGEWFSQATIDTSNWLTQAWSDTSQWAEQAWKDSSVWISQAWDNSSVWVSQVWTDSSNWVTANWSQFVIWINTLTSDNPYAWINDDVMAEGILAYEQFAELRSFLSSNPDVVLIRENCAQKAARLSLLDEDNKLIWDTIEQWADENDIPLRDTLIIAIPFLDRLIIEGSAAIGEGTILTGSVVAKYLMAVLETINIKGYEMRTARMNRLMSTLDSMTRPIIVGDEDQNVLVTEDGLYIENYT